MGLIGKLKSRSLFGRTHEMTMLVFTLAVWRERLARKNPYKKISKSLLNRAREHFLAASKHSCEALPGSSERWNTLLQLIGKNIQKFQSVEEALSYSQNKMPFDHRVHAASIYNVFTLYELQLRTEFPQFTHLINRLGESPFVNPHTLFKWGRRRLVSNVFYYHLRELLVCMSYVGKPDRVLEIGSGYGALARLFMVNPEYQPECYFLLDLPQTLFFAELYLRLNLPDTQITYYDEKTDLKKARGIMLVPIQKSEELIDSGLFVDLLINSGSIGEIADEWVEYWSSWMDRMDCRYFYSLNYFGLSIDDWGEGANSYSPRLSSRWAIRLNRMNPEFLKLQSSRHFAEIIFEKMESAQTEDSFRLKERYLWTKERVFDLSNLLECMDIARLTDDPEILLDILKRCVHELPEMPKESIWLLKKLEAKHSGQSVLLESLKQKIEKRSEAAAHDLVDVSAFD